MNIRDLKYLIAVADYQHFSKAAEACFVSQPGLSTQIKKLEESLGVTLIERNNKNVQLTEVGKAILQQAREILAHVEAIKTIARQAEDPFSGALHLGIIPTLAPYLLPHILPNLSRHFPKLHLYLIEDTTDNLLEKLAQGKLDAALLAIPVLHDALTAIPLFEETFSVAVSKQHDLAKRKKISIGDLKNQTVLLLEEGHCLREQALSVCHQTQVIESTNFQATSLETLKQMVAFNAGITLVPALSEQPHSMIKYIPFEESQPQRTIGMVYRHSCVKKALLNAITIEIKHSLAHTPVRVLA